MTGIGDLHPAFILVVGAALLPVVPAPARSVLALASQLAGLAALAGLGSGARIVAPFAGFELVLLQVDPLSHLFGFIFLLIGTIAAVYAWHLRDAGQQSAALLYGAGALGVTFAGDLLTLLIFWELMAASSVWLVFARRRPESTGAGFRYLMVHLAGGAALFAGIILQYQQAGTMEIQPLAPSGGWASWLILAGVALNVALPPLHAWLPDAYPRATVTGAVYLSALTTKSAVCVLMKLFAGWEILLYGGVLMALYGVIYAVLANDIRQILAYHIISQVGYMVAGVGIGSALSLNGTAAHAFSHILYKALLFMGAGAVIQATGASKLTDLGGLRRHMRAVLWLFMVGAFSISGLPLLNGFISKSIIVSAAGDAHRPVAVLGLLLASVGTFLSIGLKIPAFAFWGPERRLRLRPIPANMYVAMGGAAVLCALYGVFPGLLYRILPHPMQYEPYTAYHLVESVQLLSFTFVGFWLLRGKLAGEPFIALDTDWFYRRSGTLLLRHIVAPIHESFVWGARSRDAVVDRIVRGFQNPMDWFAPWRGPRGAFDPDRERTPLAASLCFVLFFLVVLALIAIRS